jgi:serine/threonine protein phosphatase 1
MRKFIIADIHGEYDKLMECLQAVDFDYENDQLIQLGDIVDRGPKSYECVEELLKINNLIAIRGNHDATWMESFETGKNMLYDQGGRETLLSYTRSTDCENDPTRIPVEHQLFFKNQRNYYIDENKNVFVHGGFNRHQPLEDQQEDESIYYWDRDLFLAALSYEAMKDKTHSFKYKDDINEIFVGHTPTTYWGSSVPMKAANITNLDCGSGKGGKLVIMNLETKEYFQSK